MIVTEPTRLAILDQDQRKRDQEAAARRLLAEQKTEAEADRDRLERVRAEANRPAATTILENARV